MTLRRSLPASIVLACVGLLSACVSVDIDETDRSAFFVDGRMRKDLDDSDGSTGAGLELAWTSVRGDVDDLDYSIDNVTAGAAMLFPAGDEAWLGVSAGLAWQHHDLEPPVVELDEDDGYGLYIAFEGGWRPVTWLEPYARIQAAHYFNEVSSMLGLEGGVRVHVIEHVALFGGWRYTRFNIDDIDSEVGISQVELDTSGLVVGLALSF